MFSKVLKLFELVLLHPQKPVRPTAGWGAGAGTEQVTCKQLLHP